MSLIFVLKVVYLSKLLGISIVIYLNVEVKSQLDYHSFTRTAETQMDWQMLVRGWTSNMPALNGKLNLIL
jgi:hypothetical protein